MITITKYVSDTIIRHAQQELPLEACGYLAGKDGVIVKAYPMTNIDQSPEHFSFDPKEQFAVIKDARNEGLSIMANYHSHPTTPARPSDEDIRLAYDPNIIYMILSLMNRQPVLKLFRIIDTQVIEEELHLTENL